MTSLVNAIKDSSIVSDQLQIGNTHYKMVFIELQVINIIIIALYIDWMVVV